MKEPLSGKIPYLAATLFFLGTGAKIAEGTVQYFLSGNTHQGYAGIILVLTHFACGSKAYLCLISEDDPFEHHY